MTDRKFAILKKKVEKIANEWRDIIGLHDHRLRYKFIREKHSEGNTVAQIYPLWQYKHHTLEFYMPTVDECDSDEELEEDILHELVHILIAPASGNDAPSNQAEREVREYATQCITYALLWAREAGKKNAKV